MHSFTQKAGRGAGQSQQVEGTALPGGGGAAGPEAGGLAALRPGWGTGGAEVSEAMARLCVLLGAGLSEENCYWLTFRDHPACCAENRLGKREPGRALW